MAHALSVISLADALSMIALSLGFSVVYFQGKKKSSADRYMYIIALFQQKWDCSFSIVLRGYSIAEQQLNYPTPRKLNESHIS
jgi:hypothetical protein